MTRTRYLRKKRGNPWTPESSKRANQARWAADRARRDAEEPERIRELAAHPPILPGSVIGSLEYRCLITGKIHRWTIQQGDRLDQVKLRTPDKRQSKSMGWARALSALRPYLCGRKI